MATAIANSLTDHSPLDGTNDAINGAEVDANPMAIAQILDGTTATDLGGAGTLDILSLRVLDLGNAAGAVQTNLVLEWDPADGGQMTDNSSGVGIDFKMPDDGDAQDVFGSINAICLDDAAGGEDGEFSFKTMKAGTNTEILTLSATSGITLGVDDTGYDVKFFGATSGQYMLWDESADELVLAGDSKLSFHDAAGGENIIATSNGHLEVNAGTTLDITAPTVDLNSTTKFNIDTAAYDLNASGAVTIDSAGVSIDSSAASNLTTSGGALTITSAAAATWSTAAGALTLGSGAAINITPASGSVILLDGAISVDAGVVTGATAITLSGELDAGSLDISGDADIDGTLEADAITIGSTAIGSIYGVVAGSSSIVTVGTIGTGTWQGTAIASSYVATLNQDTTGTAALATTVTITDNESTNETNAIIFTAGGDVDGGDLGLESDGNLTYNPSSGLLSATAVTATGAVNTGALTSTGNISFDGGSFVFNEAGADKDFRIEGDTNANLFVADASTDKIGIGVAVPTSRLHVQNSGTSAYALEIDASDGSNLFGVWEDSDGTGQVYLRDAAGDGKVLLDSGGSSYVNGGPLFIGDTANANMTVGLTINQAANDDEILALKSSDVTHDVTSFAQDDTYGLFKKAHAASGGLLIRGLKDDDGAAATDSHAVLIQGCLSYDGGSGAADTTKNVAGIGVVTISGFLANSGGNMDSVGADGNILVITNGSNTRFIFDAEGTAHADVGTATYSDARLKSNIRDLPYGIDTVKALQPRIFDRQSGFLNGGEVVLEDKKRVQIGLIAQECKDLIKELVIDPTNDSSFYSMDYARLSVVNLAAIKELISRVEKLEMN
jgi:cytoskeletal protein CcmA (bactofilin family)